VSVTCICCLEVATPAKRFELEPDLTNAGFALAYPAIAAYTSQAVMALEPGQGRKTAALRDAHQVPLLTGSALFCLEDQLEALKLEHQTQASNPSVHEAPRIARADANRSNRLCLTPFITSSPLWGKW
jgi:hypothetical protein